MLDLIKKSIEVFSPAHEQEAKLALSRVGPQAGIVEIAVALRDYYENRTVVGHQDFPNPFYHGQEEHRIWSEAYNADILEVQEEASPIDPVNEDENVDELLDLEAMTKKELEAYAREHHGLELDLRQSKDKLLVVIAEAVEGMTAE